MSVSTSRFSRGRITGLALIAVVTLGLGYLHFAGVDAATHDHVELFSRLANGEAAVQRANRTVEHNCGSVRPLADLAPSVLPEHVSDGFAEPRHTIEP